MKIAFIRPNLGNYRSSDAMPPLAIGILAARSADADMVFFDEKVEVVPLDADVDLVALSVETFTARRAYAIADVYRQQGKTVVMGGYHPTFLPNEALLHADAIVVGDAEGAWEKLLRDFQDGQLEKIYQGDNKRPLVDYQINRAIFKGKKYAPIELAQFGRGCRFVCDFCSIASFYGPNVRSRPLEALQEELIAIASKKLLFFVDDNLFGNKKTLLDLFEMMKPLKIRWSCQISIDVARDPDLLDKLAESGCCFVLIGFESLIKENLRQMGKRWNNVAGDYKQVVENLHKRGIGIYGTFVFGYDADTRESIDACVDFAIEARLEIANFNPLTPTPGSPLYDRLLAEDRLISPQWWLDPAYKYGDAIFLPKSMSPDDLAEGVFEARKRFYSLRSIGLRILDSDTRFSFFKTSVSATANIISRTEIRKKNKLLLGV